MRLRISRDEEGAFLILYALLMTAVLIMVAIVIDLGNLRDTRRQSQRTADLAAIAAGQDLAGGSIVNACTRALDYVKSNTRDMGSLPTNGCAVFDTACKPALPPLYTSVYSFPYVVTIRNPIPHSEIEDPSYPVNAATGTRTLDADGKPCERMRITIQKTNSAVFAGVANITSLTTRATAVIRGFVGTNPKQNAGLVVLERTGCGVIETSGQGGVLVKGSIASDGTPRPGIIQLDTRALSDSGNCTNGGNVPSKYAVFGGKLPSGADRPGEPSVLAEAVGGAPGRLDMYALTDFPANTHTAYDVPGGGVSPAPTPGVIASRNVVDKVYNKPSSGPGRVSKLKTDSSALLTSLQAAATTCPTCNVLPAPAVTTPACTTPSYFVYPPGTPGGPDPNGCPPITPSAGLACSSNSATLIDISAAYDKVFVNCSTLAVKRVRFSGTKFVFAGMIKIGSGSSALFPNAEEMIVKGCDGCSGGDKVGIDVAGSFIVNSGPTTPLVQQCDDNLDNDGDGKTDEFNRLTGTGDVGCKSVKGWDEIDCSTERDLNAARPNRLVLLTGPIETSSASEIEFCQTFVLMADGSNLPDQEAATDPTCLGYTDVSGVLFPQPCPSTNSYKGYLRIQGDIDWSAPNQTSLRRDTSVALQNFEDLALWTETSDPSTINGAGATVTSGVFFFPNARTSFSGLASQFIDLNAQYIARRLVFSGQGTLAMKPNPNDVVETPAPYFRLIR